jgi:aspartate/tyrosine/aromatic aminotransferase
MVTRVPQEYLPIQGNPEFCRLSAQLAFGENSRVVAERRNATVQGLSGTGSLRVREHRGLEA